MHFNPWRLDHDVSAGIAWWSLRASISEPRAPADAAMKSEIGESQLCWVIDERRS